ncbi:hypothetical protein [Streptomyces canus]|nr:hypothetical protein [Streptomyces canus]MDQ1069935.1 hypothetical protein [Streptomyces canus]
MTVAPGTSRTPGPSRTAGDSKVYVPNDVPGAYLPSEESVG